MPAGAKRLLLVLTASQRRLFEDAASREGLALREWLLAAAELAITRGSTR